MTDFKSQFDYEDIRVLELKKEWPTVPPEIRPSLGEPNDMLRRVISLEEGVFKNIDRYKDEEIEFLQKIVKTKSVNPSVDYEEPLAELLMEDLKELGMEVKLVKAAEKRISVSSVLKGSVGDRTLIFFSHLDTVPEGSSENWMSSPFDAAIVNNRIVGRGVKDCKLGIASSVMAIRAIQKAGIKLKGNVSIALGADEEAGGQYGIARMIEAGMIKGDYCIYCEGSPEHITIGARGFCNMEITVEGKSSHTATKQDGVNAIVMMSRVVPHLENMKFTGWKPHPVLQGEPVISVNAITGGLRDNIVPDKCSVVVDIRFLPGMTIDDITANVKRVLDDLKRSDPALKDLKYSLRSVAVGRPVFISPNEPFVGLMSKAVEAVTERIPIPKGSFASSDSRWIVLDAGIPTINFSMGNDSGHKPNEYVPIEDYIKNIKIYALIMLMYLT